MTSNNQVSPVIRISRGERDASARATHLKAASKKYLETTIERKYMSNTTTFKRIALVVTAALAFSGISAVSAQAATNTQVFCQTADGDAGVAKANGSTRDVCNGVAGPANYVTLSGTAGDGKDVLVTVAAPGKFVAAPSVTNWTIATDGLSATNAAGGDDDLRVMTPTVGTYTVSVFVAAAGSGVFGATALETVVITVTAAVSAGTYSATESSFLMAAGETRTVGTTDATVLVSSAENKETAVATIRVVLKDTLKAAISDTITATIISGPGTIGVARDTTTIGVAGATNGQTDSRYSQSWRVSATDTTSSSTALNNVIETQTAGTLYFLVYANGQSGTSTVTFRNTAGTVLATKTLAFASPVASTISAVVKKAFIKAGTAENVVTNQKVFAVTVKDSGGNSITTGTLTSTAATGSLVGSNGSCSYDSTDKVWYCSAGGVAVDKFGAVVYTFKHTNATDNSSVTTTATTTFADSIAAKLTITAPATATPGTEVTYTLTATTAEGTPVADGVYESDEGVTGNFGRFFASAVYSSSGYTPFVVGDTITTVSGVATSKVFLPFAAGTVSATWTLTGTAGTASGALAKELTATKIAPAISITDSGALALAEVLKLSTTVASLRTLIVTLTNLVLKIQKKVKA
jgi:trimeric autotransporter adhesin